MCAPGFNGRKSPRYRLTRRAAGAIALCGPYRTGSALGPRLKCSMKRRTTGRTSRTAGCCLGTSQRARAALPARRRKRSAAGSICAPAGRVAPALRAREAAPLPRQVFDRY